MSRSFVPSPPDITAVDYSFTSQTNWDLPSQSFFPENGLQKTAPFGGEGFLNHSQSHRQYASIPHQRSLETTNYDRNHIQLLPERVVNTQLHSVSELPERYHGIFSNFSHFNLVQSRVFNDVLYNDTPLVTSAPTGSGKTVLFELAIVRLLIQMNHNPSGVKIIYVAPIKALCAERFEDWSEKFGPLGLQCSELTGDSQLDDYFELQNAHIIMTTPEKWDSMTRKWRDNKALVQMVQLFLIDEIHQLNDKTRGPTMEAIVCRMKTVQASATYEGRNSAHRKTPLLRFIAVSATVPNIEDVAVWLGSERQPAVAHSIDESHRPVQLRRVVLSYPDATTDFKFDLSLNYKLSNVIHCYSDHKPTLVFCATRKGTQQAAATLTKDAKFIMNMEHKRKLQSVAAVINDSKLRDLVSCGVGFHHAGMSVSDRKNIEAIFYNAQLPVLFATSTLAMGVNLPAHLVVIKSTMHYANGMFQEYSESQVLQMIGRAGRPQFDTTATAVIMTRNSTKSRYDALLGGTQLVESNLHSHLIEHLNAEIVLRTITDVSIALDWLKSTFLYTRIRKNPKHYGIPEHLPTEGLQEKLQEMCLENLKELEAVGLLTMDDGFTLIPTESGRLMARYYVAFESMKRFMKLKSCDSISDLVEELSKCKEFEDVRLRVSEKRILNQLNKDKHRQTIRFPMSGKIKSTDMKVNCLIQASLGCLSIQEFSLNQDSQKIFRSASRLSKCLMELQMLETSYSALLNCVLLHKCICARLWEDSKHIAKQLDKIGVTLSTALVNAGLTSFDKILEKNARELELIVNRHPPFGNQVKEAANKMPKYALEIEQSSLPATDQADLSITVSLLNYQLVCESGSSASSNHCCVLIIGDKDDGIVLKQKINDSQLLTTGKWFRQVRVSRAKKGCELAAHFLSLNLVGIDVNKAFTPQYTGYGKWPLQPIRKEVHNPVISKDKGTNSQTTLNTKLKRPCNHRCLNKTVCGHDCCKYGQNETFSKQNNIYSAPNSSTRLMHPKTPASTSSGGIYRHLDKVHQKVQCITPVSSVQRLKVNTSGSDLYKCTPSETMKRFEYKPARPVLKDSFEPANSNGTMHTDTMDNDEWCFDEASNEFDHLNMEQVMCHSETEWGDLDYLANEAEDEYLFDISPSPPPLPPPKRAFSEIVYSIEESDDIFENFDITETIQPSTKLTFSAQSATSVYRDSPKRQCIRNDVTKQPQVLSDTTNHFSTNSHRHTIINNTCTPFNKPSAPYNTSYCPPQSSHNVQFTADPSLRNNPLDHAQEQTYHHRPERDQATHRNSNIQNFFCKPTTCDDDKPSTIKKLPPRVEDDDIFGSVFAGIF